MVRLSISVSLAFVSQAATAQELSAPTQMSMGMRPVNGWQVMQDGILFAEWDHQGGPRGGDQFVAPNWWMGMATRGTGAGRFALNAMVSLDPATVGRSGYRELFQSGEALDGKPIVDRQHPHDLLMQLAAIWRIPVGASTGLTIAGGPAGEPALGPVAFMHRASAADNPTAPLSHHTFDSTHVAYGVVTAAVDRRRWVVEGSLFNGREPDDNRWNLDFGRLDSVSGRVWYRPNDQWELQASSGRLKGPERLEPGNIVRSTASASWMAGNGASFSAITFGYGRNDTNHGARSAVFIEGARHVDANTLYARVEALQVETALLQTGVLAQGAAADARNVTTAFTAGAVRDVIRWNGFEGGLGADVTFYRVPEALRSMYASRPVSFHVFVRLRPPVGAMGRMWNMRMSQPMPAHHMAGMGG